MPPSANLLQNNVCGTAQSTCYPTAAIHCVAPLTAEHQELTIILYNYNDWAPNEELGRASLALRELQSGQEQEVALHFRATGDMVFVRAAGCVGAS